jgi:hypothetical protein
LPFNRNMRRNSVAVLYSIGEELAAAFKEAD